MLPSSSLLQRDLHALWETKRGDRSAPSRHAFDVLELRPWLGFICLVDVLAQGGDFRYRIFGTRIANVIGRELTGRYLSQVEPGLREGLLPGYLAVSQSWAPATFSPALRDAWRTIRLSELVLPLSTDGRSVDMLLTCCYPA